MKRVSFLAIVAVTFSVLSANAEDPKPEYVREYIDGFIETTTKKASENQMGASSRKYVVGDINGDGNGDVVLLYDLLGPTYSYTQLAVFVLEKGELKSKGEIELQGEVDLDGVNNGKIMVSGKKLGKDDPLCCPSVSFKSAYVLKGDKFVEVTP